MPYATERRQSLPACGAAATIEPSTDMGKNAHIRVPIYQQQQAMRVAAKQFVNDVSSPPDEGAEAGSVLKGSLFQFESYSGMG